MYSDPVFKESGTWKMSTSHLVSEYFDGWGYGEVTPDGFGCSYTVKENTVQFNGMYLWCSVVQYPCVSCKRARRHVVVTVYASSYPSFRW